MKIVLFSRLTLLGRRYYWKAVAGNGESVAIGGEAYNSKDKRDAGIMVARACLSPTTTVEVRD